MLLQDLTIFTINYFVHIKHREFMLLQYHTIFTINYFVHFTGLKI